MEVESVKTLKFGTRILVSATTHKKYLGPGDDGGSGGRRESIPCTPITGFVVGVRKKPIRWLHTFPDEEGLDIRFDTQQTRRFRPFRCQATDIIYGHVVEFKEYLSRNSKQALLFDVELLPDIDYGRGGYYETE